MQFILIYTFLPFYR